MVIKEDEKLTTAMQKCYHVRDRELGPMWGEEMAGWGAGLQSPGAVLSMMSGFERLGETDSCLMEEGSFRAKMLPAGDAEDRETDGRERAARGGWLGRADESAGGAPEASAVPLVLAPFS